MTNDSKPSNPRSTPSEGLLVSWFSGGVSSFVATYLLREELDRIVYIHIDDQHPDTMRFLRDSEELLGRHIEILQHDTFKTVEDVARKNLYINTQWGARCTQWLKKDVRLQWERRELDAVPTYVWGFDAGETGRVGRILETQPEYNHRFPLIEQNLNKADCHGIAERLGLQRPAMYDLGYNNNNCIGCVKGGMGYWNRIRVDFPEVFAARAKLEREIGSSCINGVYLDELDPSRGNFADDVPSDCSILCQIALDESADQ